MSRALLRIDGPVTRARAADLLARVPDGTRVEFKGGRRTLPQNDRMWAMLTDVARQKEHAGRRFTPDQWKVLFLHAIGREVQFLPSLEGDTFIPWGQSSSDLSKTEMSELIEFIAAWGAQNGVVFQDDMWEAPHEPG
jgi:hypothetical protein